MPNNLARELSPYLLQHAENPVEWYAWGEEAFEKARAEDKPIFLSIGYSTCHWCHVMERESFENPEIAALMNQGFVSVKVDREERPDIDRVYMAFVQATTGSGGWPMSVWLTPELKPFFGGTYFPPTSLYGRPGFSDVLTRMTELWADDRDRLVTSAEALMDRLREAQSDEHRAPGEDGRQIATVDTLAAGVTEYERSFDGRHGGFGRAPKFPRPAELVFLLREYARTGNVNTLNMVLATLRGMADGGMRDHIGGGFHRYSVDAEWRIPHFEKMLYDQAQLVLTSLDAAQASGEAEWLAVAEDTLGYVARDLTGEAGEFHSAEDADSVPPHAANAATAEKSEGAFYLWSSDELDRHLNADADTVKLRYGVEADGNAPHDPTGEFRGLNHLYLARSEDEVAEAVGATGSSVHAALERAREVLLAVRGSRPRPHLDDKVLAAWNGLMIGAAARAGWVLEGSAGADALGMAERAAEFARGELWDAASRRLRRRYRSGQVSIDGYCEDYAFMVFGALELFQTTGRIDWLAWARELQHRQDELFWDDAAGGWFSTTDADASVLLRVKDEYDGAEPSAGSVSVLNLLTLSHLDPDGAEARRKVEWTLARFGDRFGHAARVVPLMAAALSQYHAGTTQIVIVGPHARDDTQRLYACVRARFLPCAVRILVDPEADQTDLMSLLPFVAPMTMVNEKATAFVCTNFACQAPVTEPSALEVQLRSL